MLSYKGSYRRGIIKLSFQ